MSRANWLYHLHLMFAEEDARIQMYDPTPEETQEQAVLVELEMIRLGVPVPNTGV